MSITQEGHLIMNAHATISTTSTYSSKQETADGYDRVLFLAPCGRLRIVGCRDDLQWIVQTRASMGSLKAFPWAGRSYCRTKAGLRIVTGAAHYPDSPALRAFVETLPDTFPSKVAR
jgi:hypothetical protein